MATIGATYPTLADLASRLDKDDGIADIIEILNLTNEILEDIVWYEANNGTSHKTTVRGGLPSGTWRILNYGVANEKTRTVPVMDTCGMLESYAEVDKDLADQNGNTKAWRLSEELGFIEGLGQTLSTALFYGNEATDPEQITGLAPRFNSTSAGNGGNIITGGTGTQSVNTSIWLVGWGPLTCHGFYKAGSKAGLQVEDKGQQTDVDSNGLKHEIYRTHYKWDVGLAVRDWRSIVRIPNLKPTDFTKDAASGCDIVTLMIKAIHKQRMRNLSKPVFYVNEDVYTYLDLQTLNASNTRVSYDKDVHGREIMNVRGIPVRMCEALVNTEATVS